MRHAMLIMLLAATVLAGCTSPSAVSTQKAAPVVAARSVFQPRLITTLGTYPTPDRSWRIGVTEDAIDFARPRDAGGVSITPQTNGWRAQAGWFVFLENESRAWAYDGGRRLYLQVFTPSGGGTYYGIFTEPSPDGNNSGGTVSFRANFPCAIPAQVMAHLPERKERAIAAKE
jgi:hypothetical protein